MRFSIYLLVTLLMFTSSCKENEKKPLVKASGAPAQLTDISVENLPGAAKITYALPDDPNVLYVLAEFGDKTKKRVVKASVFSNSVLLEGFMSTDKQEVELYVVNRAEERSKPTVVEVEPETAPIVDMFGTITVEQDFGGVSISYKNEAQNPYVLYTMIKDSTGTWSTYDRLYTESETRNYSVHGLPAEPIDFGFYVMDQWQNRSDTLFKNITPLYEEELDKSTWKLYPLDNDSYDGLYDSRPVSYIWDGTAAKAFFVDPAIPNLSLPNWLTIDMGHPAMLSRIRYYQYMPSNYESWFYTRGLIEKFELWGSNDPSIDGSWDSWTLLATCESVKPSGLPVNQLSNEDIDLGISGEDFSIPYTGKSYRYIRLKTISTWGHRIGSTWGEVTLWGKPD